MSTIKRSKKKWRPKKSRKKLDKPTKDNLEKFFEEPKEPQPDPKIG
jgi:hypothetical protein